MFIFLENATAPKKGVSVAKGEDVVLSFEERARLTNLPSEGLPEEFQEILPIYERIFGGHQNLALSAARLYHDGRYFVFSTTTNRWNLICLIIKQESINQFIQMLSSELIQNAQSNAGSSNPVLRLDRLYRFTLDGQTKEFIFGYGMDGSIDPIFDELEEFIWKFCR